MALKNGRDRTTTTTTATNTTSEDSQNRGGQEGLSVEERTKQKRMLRNRESAARSRDKQKTRNLQLQASIEELEERRTVVDSLISEMTEIITEMRNVLAKHSVKVG